MSVRIICITKSGGNHDNPHEAISTFGWINEESNETGESDRETMWKWVTDGGVAFVRDARGNIAYVQARTNSRGTHYLRTVTDNLPSDNLLALQECR